MFYRYINLQINCMHCTAYCKCKSVYVYDCTYTWGKINYSCMQLSSIQYSRVITVCVTKHLSRPLIRKHDRILIDQSRPLCCFEFLMCSFQIHPVNCKYSTMYVQIVDCIQNCFIITAHWSNQEESYPSLHTDYVSVSCRTVRCRVATYHNLWYILSK